MFSIVDISNWKYEDIFVSGSKEKRWYRKPSDNTLQLFKLPVSLTSDTWRNVNELSGEMWSEKISSEIGAILGLSVHEVNIGRLIITDEVIDHYGLERTRIDTSEIYGALCTSFLKEGEESLIEGADMIMEYDHTYDRAKLLGDKEIYSFDLLLRLFEKFEMLPHLFTMIIFDILIGNTDRHQDNFGIIRNESTMEIRFAPLYDNASCLGREMTQERIGKILKDTQMFHAYLHGKKSHSLIRWGNLNINERPNMFDLFRKIISVTPQIKHYISILDKLSDDVIDGIVYKIPKVMSDNQKLFVSRVLKTRRDILLEEK